MSTRTGREAPSNSRPLTILDAEAVADRFWPKVAVAGPGSCWLWTAARFADGYGMFYMSGRSHGAHRVAWCLANVASLRAGVLIRHACDTPLCCNPAHLTPGSPADNAADAVARGRTLAGERHPKRVDPSRVKRGSASPAWRERCRREHDPSWRYVTSSGVRRCRLCDRLVRRSS